MEKVISFEEELKTNLDLLASQQMRRSLRSVQQNDQGRLLIEGKSLLNFSSNNYLGLARHPRILEAVQQVVEHWGLGAASSRLISGTYSIHRDLEQALAAFMQTDAALVFPTGYMANLGVLTALVGSGDAIVLDRLCHASLIDAARLSGARLFVYRHGDLDEAERALKRTTSYRRRLLVTDSLFSMDGDFAPLTELSILAHRYGALSILDEAHAIGVWGDGGRGVRCGGETETRRDGDAVKRPDNFSGSASPSLRVSVSSWDVVVGTLSKSLGSQGGFVCGSQPVIDTLINNARSFIFTTGLSPACVAAAHAALSLIQEDSAPRRHLQKLSGSLREGLRTLGFDTLRSESQIVPILLGSAGRALAIAARLEAAGIFAPAIRPPAVHAGQCRLRFSITSEHTQADVDQLIQALGSIPERGSEGELHE